VRVQWTRSGFDFVGDPNQIVEYAVYRRIEPNLKAPSVTLDKSSISNAAYEHAASKQSLGWDFLMTVPVRVQDSYSVVAPTLADSTIAVGQQFSSFMVSALTATPGVFFDSPPDSGYSVDNLAPAVPQNFAADYSGTGTGLVWDDAPEADLQFYRVYRDVVPDFAPAPANLLQEVSASEFHDPTASPWNYYYKVSAVDYSGNEGPAAATGTITAAPGRGTGRFALHPPTPNPFNPSTLIAFEMRRAGRATLRVFDLAGRLVTTLIDGRRDAGRHEIRWDGTDAAGRSVSSGVYIYRFEAHGGVLTQRMTLIK
jgi:hypothetical protein